MRFGLVGTGPWARDVHGPGLGSSPQVELVGVWGRTPAKAGSLAQSLGVESFTELDSLLDQVDAVAFAVPPDVQVELALRAAEAGRHLLLDKPVGTDASEARRLAAAARAADVASVVFFTDRFTDSGAAWFTRVQGSTWLGGDVRWLAALDAPGGPHTESVWRREQGALWDIGPHALATLLGALGPATEIHAVAGKGDLVHLVLTHVSGATSTATLSLFVPPEAITHDVTLWGATGLSRMPARIPDEEVPALARAAESLVASARSGEPHAADLRLGVQVTELLADAAAQLARS